MSGTHGDKSLESLDGCEGAIGTAEPTRCHAGWRFLIVNRFSPNLSRTLAAFSLS